MTLTEAREWVGGVWCAPETKHKVMDVDLAEVMSKLLMSRVNETIVSEKIFQARMLIARYLIEDKKFFDGYKANIAMVLYDETTIRPLHLDTDKANYIAEKILTKLFLEDYPGREIVDHFINETINKLEALKHMREAQVDVKAQVDCKSPVS